MRPVLGIKRTKRLSEDSVPYKHHYFNFLVELTQDEFEWYLEASAALNGFLSDAQLFRVVLLNYQEYYDTLHFHLQEYIQRGKGQFDTRRSHLDINRCLLNWLSSVRMYLDHTETRVKRRYGDTSQNWERLKQYYSNEYDNNFSYRFLYRMRNYAQHCGFPIHEIKFSSVPSEFDPEKPIHTLKVGCIRDNLLSEFDGWGRPLKEELPKLPSVIDVNPHIDAMMGSLEKINANHTRDEFLMLRESAELVKSLFQRAVSDEGEPGVFEIEVVEDETGKVTDISRIVAHSTPLGLVDAVISGRIENMLDQFVVKTM